MDQICYELMNNNGNINGSSKLIINPHKHWIRDGDYDINVLMITLIKQGY